MAGTSEKADVQVVWAGGHRTTAQITRPVASLTQLSYYPQLAHILDAIGVRITPHAVAQTSGIDQPCIPAQIVLARRQRRAPDAG